MPSQDTRTDAERAAWEAAKAEQREYQAENRAWYEKTMTAGRRGWAVAYAGVDDGIDGGGST